MNRIGVRVALENRRAVIDVHAQPAAYVVRVDLHDQSGVVQIDTTEIDMISRRGRLRVNLNDDTIYDGDPDTDTWPDFDRHIKIACDDLYDEPDSRAARATLLALLTRSCGGTARKLDTERMVPIDEETLELVDRIVAHRSPGRPLPHPRTGKAVQFLLTHQGRRMSVDTLRAELHRAATDAGLKSVTPHQLRHTYATALINCGVSLQALMAMLGHVSAEMSLRYGRLFDETVRADYERALTQAKAQLGPVLPSRTQLSITEISGGAAPNKPTTPAATHHDRHRLAG